MLKIIKNFLILSLFLFTIFSAFPASAASGEICFKPQIKIPGMDLVFTKCTTGEGYKITGLSISQFIIAVYKYAIGIVGIVSAIVLMWAGFLWLTAGGNQARVTDAQGWIKGSLTGLALALCSFLILSTVNPSLTKFKSVDITPIGEEEIKTDSINCCIYPDPASVGPTKTPIGACTSFEGLTKKYCDKLQIVSFDKTKYSIGSECAYSDSLALYYCKTTTSSPTSVSAPKDALETKKAGEIYGCCTWENGETNWCRNNTTEEECNKQPKNWAWNENTNCEEVSYCDKQARTLRE